MSAEQPASVLKSPGSSKLFIRTAQPDDFEAITDVTSRAFSNDPVINYMGSVKKVLDEKVDVTECNSRRLFLLFLLKASFLIGGRITVVVDPGSDSDTEQHGAKEKIVSAAFWLPPKKRLAVWMIPTIVRAGAVGVIRRWGLRGLLRIVIDYQGTTESRMHHVFQERKIKTPMDNSWYLQMVAVDPKYQGQGIMSLIVREAFAHAPSGMYTLEATTAKSRDQYAHLGFENLVSIKFGQGKADAQGICKSGKDAVGVEIWGMAKWPTAETD